MYYIKTKKLCDEKGMSVSLLEWTLGFGNGTICKWKSQSPRVDTLLKVCRYFQVPMEYFVDSEGEK